MPTLSAAIITLNEEDRIREALDSVRFADEIVVVDSGSADRTVEICREFTDKVFVETWRGFAGQKNAAVERTTGDWVLSIDADEQVTAELAGEIRGVVSSGGPRDGYLVPRRNFFGGTWVRHGGWYPDYTLRLFRRGKGQFAERRVHEAVTLNGGRVGRLRSPLIHRTYEGWATISGEWTGIRRLRRRSCVRGDAARAGSTWSFGRRRSSSGTTSFARDSSTGGRASSRPDSRPRTHSPSTPSSRRWAERNREVFLSALDGSHRGPYPCLSVRGEKGIVS